MLTQSIVEGIELGLDALCEPTPKQTQLIQSGRQVIYLSIYLSVNLSIYQSIYLSQWEPTPKQTQLIQSGRQVIIYLSIYLSIYDLVLLF